jgi:DNA modification methylase
VNYLLARSDARRIPLPDGSVQMVCTSPPYFGLRSYLPDGHPLKDLEIGLEQSPSEYVAELVAVFREVRRVLRSDGTVWLNLGDSYNGGGGYSPDAPSNQGRIQFNGAAHSKTFESRKRMGHRSTKFRLRSDLTPEQQAYVLSELAKARLISDATQ